MASRMRQAANHRTSHRVCVEWALTLHVAMMFAVPVPVGQDETQDNAAGASLVILFVPTVFIVIALAGLETVIGAVWGLIGRRRTHRRADSFL